MDLVLEYKKKIDDSSRESINSILKEIKHDENLKYITKQKLFYYGYYKMDYFEQASFYLKNVWGYYATKFKEKGFEPPSILKMASGDNWIVVIFKETTDGGCCSACCSLPCACLLCDCDCGHGTMIDNIADDSNCCCINKGLPLLQDVTTTLFATGMTCLCTKPVECCASCL